MPSPPPDARTASSGVPSLLQPYASAASLAAELIDRAARRVGELGALSLGDPFAGGSAAGHPFAAGGADGAGADGAGADGARITGGGIDFALALASHASAVRMLGSSAGRRAHDLQVADSGSMLALRSDAPGTARTRPVGRTSGATAVVRSWERRGLRPAAARIAAGAAVRFRLRGIGGVARRRVAGTSSRSDHATGRAVDLMVRPRSSEGDRIAAWAIRQPGVRYVIWNRRIWTPTRGWHRYVHPGVRRGAVRDSPTLRHEDHVHVSVR